MDTLSCKGSKKITRDWYYLAGFFDGEGSLGLYKRSDGIDAIGSKYIL